jgi:hypothetical protein
MIAVNLSATAAANQSCERKYGGSSLDTTVLWRTARVARLAAAKAVHRVAAKGAALAAMRSRMFLTTNTTNPPFR